MVNLKEKLRNYTELLAQYERRNHDAEIENLVEQYRLKLIEDFKAQDDVDIKKIKHYIELLILLINEDIEVNEILETTTSVETNENNEQTAEDTRIESKTSDTIIDDTNSASTSAN